jgi:hypothetical protein
MVMPDDDALAGTAMFEACLLHARAVDEFLSDAGKGGWQCRVLAAEYFDSPDDWKPLEVLTKLEGDAISRKVAHVFCDRERADLNWATTGDCTDLAMRLLDGMDFFCDQLAEQQPGRAAWFEEGIDSARAALQSAKNGEVVVTRLRPGTPGAIPFWEAGDQSTR